MITYFINRLENYSKETLIAEIKRVATIITNEKIRRSEFNIHSKVSDATIARTFGGWKNALIAAELGHRYGGPQVTKKMLEQNGKRVTKEICLEDIRTIANKLHKETITHINFNDNSIYKSGVVVERFG